MNNKSLKYEKMPNKETPNKETSSKEMLNKEMGNIVMRNKYMGRHIMGKVRRTAAAAAAVSLVVGLAACSRTPQTVVPSPEQTAVQAVTDDATTKEAATKEVTAEEGSSAVVTEPAAEVVDSEAGAISTAAASERPSLAISHDYWYELNQESYTECIVSCEYVVPLEDEASVHSGLAKSLADREEEVRTRYRIMYGGYLEVLKGHSVAAVEADVNGRVGQAAAQVQDNAAAQVQDNAAVQDSAAVQSNTVGRSDAVTQDGAEVQQNAAVTTETIDISKPFIVEEKVFVRRGDERVLSVLEEEKGSKNGEDYVVYDAVSYDVSSGKVLSLEDVVSDVAAFRDALAEGCEKQGISKEAFAAALKERTDNGRELCWTMEPQGLTVWFSAGEVDDKANGGRQVSLLFSECSGLLTGAYGASAGKQTSMFPADSVMVFDAGADGQRDILTVKPQMDEGNYSMQDVVIALGDKSYVEDEIYAHDVHPYLVLNDNGKSMLYIEYVFDNDYRSLGIFDLNGGEPRMADMRDDHFRQIYDTEYFVTCLFNNPDSFRLATRLDLLSTCDGYRYAHIGDDGMPVFDSIDYVFDRELTITTKQAIKADLVDKERGQVTQIDVEVSGGEPLKLYSSDNKSYVDAVTKDGAVVRIYVDTSGWPVTVNGKDIYDCFDGMFFAG